MAASITTTGCQKDKQSKPRSKRKRTLGAKFNKQIYGGKERTTGRFAKGNQFWKARAKCGRLPKFHSAEQLLHDCEDYFKWIEENPLYEQKIAGIKKGRPIIVKIPKHRPMTIRGLCLFLGISQVTWWRYKKRSSAFLNICCRVEQIIWVQKFEGAVVGFFKPSIIARELSLKSLNGH